MCVCERVRVVIVCVSVCVIYMCVCVGVLCVCVCERLIQCWEVSARPGQL